MIIPEKLYQFTPVREMDQNGACKMVKSGKDWVPVYTIDVKSLEDHRQYGFIDGNWEFKVHEGFFIKDNINSIDYIMMESFATVSILKSWCKDTQLGRKFDWMSGFNDFIDGTKTISEKYDPLNEKNNNDAPLSDPI